MGVEAPVCLLNQFPVKSLLIRAGFVSADQQDCRALRVEGKGNPPRTIRGVEPKLLHVGMLRPVQRIGMGTAELRSEVLEQLAQRRKLVLRGFRQFCELRIELRMQKYRPLVDVI